MSRDLLGLVEETGRLLVFSEVGRIMGTVGVLVGVGFNSTLVRVAQMLTSCSSTASWLSLTGESGEAGDGFRRAWMRSLAVTTAISAEDAGGMAS
jgi:hypothetical protein